MEIEHLENLEYLGKVWYKMCWLQQCMV